MMTDVARMFKAMLNDIDFGNDPLTTDKLLDVIAEDFRRRNVTEESDNSLVEEPYFKDLWCSAWARR